MPRKIVDVKGTPELWVGMDKNTSFGTWTYATEAKANLLFLAGAVPLDDEGKIVGKGDMKKQIKQVIFNIGKVLEAAGLTLGDIINLRVYTTNIDEFLRLTEWRCAEFPEIWGKRPGDQTAPSGTLIEIKRLAGKDYLLEIEAIAERGL